MKTDKMTGYYIYNICDDEYVAVPVGGPKLYDEADGYVEIDESGAWIPGSQQDLRAALADAALLKYHQQNNKSRVIS